MRQYQYYHNAIVLVLYHNAIVLVLYHNAIVLVLYHNAIVLVLYHNAIVLVFYQAGITMRQYWYILRQVSQCNSTSIKLFWSCQGKKVLKELCHREQTPRPQGCQEDLSLSKGIPKDKKYVSVNVIKLEQSVHDIFSWICRTINIIIHINFIQIW